jgi:flagellar protein FliO/FliZ
MNTGTDFLRVLIALLVVLGLLALLNYLVRRYGHALGLPTIPQVKGARRLQIVEMLPLDPRNKIVLVRRDNTEHLLVIGATNTQVIEQNISVTETS